MSGSPSRPLHEPIPIALQVSRVRAAPSRAGRELAGPRGRAARTDSGVRPKLTGGATETAMRVSPLAGNTYADSQPCRPVAGRRPRGDGPVAEPAYGAAGSPIEVVPVVVLSQVFTARPSSIPDIRDFVRRCLAESPLTAEGNREVGETVFRALLDAAGPTGSIQVAFRIFPEHVEVDVLHSDSQIPQLAPAGGGNRPATAGNGPAADTSVGTGEQGRPAAAGPAGRS